MKTIILNISAFILLLANILFHGLILTWCYAFAFAMMHLGKLVNHYPTNLTMYACSYGTIMLLCILALSPLNYLLTLLLLKVRPATKIEAAEIQAILRTVLIKANAVTRSAPLTNIHIMISADSNSSVQVFGSNIIILSQNLFKNLPAEEMQAICAYCINGLQTHDGVLLALLVYISLISQILSKIFSLMVRCVTTISKTLGRIEGLFNFLGILVLIVFSPVIAANYIMKNIFSFSLKLLLAQCTYRADCFVVELQFGDGLLRFLARLNNPNSNANNTVFTNIMASIPSPTLRIARLYNITKHATYPE